MTAIAKAVSSAFRSATSDSEIFKQIALFCAAGLFVSLLMLSYGVDLNPGLF